MKEILKFELNRAAKSRGLIISLGISNLIVLLDLFFFYKEFAGTSERRIAIQAWIGTEFIFAYNSLFYVLFPIIAALPFAGSYYSDLQSGYIKNICLKTSRKDYYIAKYCATFLFGAIAVMLPLLLNLILCVGIYPMHRPEKLLFTSAGIIDVNLLSYFFQCYPALYSLFFILIDGAFAGMLAVFSICIAEHVESFFSVIATTFAVYVLLGVALVGQYKNWSLMEMINPMQRVITGEWQLIICLIGGIFITLVWIYLKGRRKDII